MKNLPHITVLWAVILLSQSVNSWAALKPAETDEFNGKTAPHFFFSTLQGKKLSLEEFKGHPVLLNFFASWCPPCRQEVGELMKLHEKYGSQGLQIVGAAADSKMIPETSAAQEESDVQKLSGQLGIPYPVTIADQKLVEAYDFKGIPTTVFIDRGGKIVKVFYGYHSAEAFEDVLDKLLQVKQR